MDERHGAAERDPDRSPAAFIEEAFDEFDRELARIDAAARGKSTALAVAYTSKTRAGIPERWLIELFDTTVEWDFLERIETLFRSAPCYGLILVHADQWVDNARGGEEHPVLAVERGEPDALRFLHRNIVRPCCEMLFQYDLLKAGCVGPLDRAEEAAG